MDETKTRAIPDAGYHEEIDTGNIAVYRGTDPLPAGTSVFIDIAYRGAAKTTRTKLFFGFVLGNDNDHHRRYMKVLSENPINSQQTVTDVYNMYVDRKIRHFYPEVFQKTPEKRVETMNEFETATNVKMLASTVGVAQRGHSQDEYRPDFIWFDDFESRKTLRSAVVLQSVWDNMQEAFDGLSRTGGALYTCNYLSERGNVHKLVSRYPEQTLIVPIKGYVELRESNGILEARHINGPPTWPASYTKAAVESILAKADDPAGEYLCTPSAGADVYFDRATLDKQERKEPVKVIADFKIFHEFDPSHRYGSGHDVAGGVGLDSSTSVFIDFTQMPARVVATFKSNTIKPEVFGDEIESQANRFGRPIVAPENNKFDACIGRLKQIYDNIFVMFEKETRAGTAPRIRQWGWNTNRMTKSTMLSALKKAIADGHLELSDPDLIAEARAFTRDDFMDSENDPRTVLATRHFDLLIACAIAFQMNPLAEVQGKEEYRQPAYEGSSEYESGSQASQRAHVDPMPIFKEDLPQQEYQQPPYEGASEYES